MSISHIAYGPKDRIDEFIEKKRIPKNCLVITRVEGQNEFSELFFYDSNFVPHPISTKNYFESIEAATTWANEYYCVGQYFVVRDGVNWHTYIVGENNELITVDGSDKVDTIQPANGGISVGGTATNPTVGVVLDSESIDGLQITNRGLKLNQATASTAGAMSASDKDKLNGIEPGAQANAINTIEQGTQNGTISVNGVDVAVTGLGSAAFASASSFQPAGAGLDCTIVEELPENGNPGILYLVPNTGEESNVYDEYLFIDGTPELIGTTKADLSDYYTKAQTSAAIQDAVDYVMANTTNTSTMADVAMSGSYYDLLSRPSIPVILEVTKRNNYYYANITFNAAKQLLTDGAQVAIHWSEDDLVYQCVLWRSSSSYLYFGVQDNTTYRLLQWNGSNERIMPLSNTTFATPASFDSYYTKGEIDALLANYVSAASIEWMYKHKGSVATYANLPSVDNVVGDVYDVQETGMNYVWTGSGWDALGASSAEVASIENNDIDSIVP